MMGWMAPSRHLSAKLLSDRISSEREPSMGEVTTIGLDLAKHVFLRCISRQMGTSCTKSVWGWSSQTLCVPVCSRHPVFAGEQRRARGDRRL
jgi:hypothetical protein